MHHFSFMARFSAWVNDKLYPHVAALDEASYRAPAGLFFGSIHATLNHILIVDRLWTGRVKGIDRGVRALNQVLHDDLSALRAARREEDAYLIQFMDGLSEADLQARVRYNTVSGDTPRAMEARVWDMLTGLYNHQTHHRGQVYGLLLQKGIKLPDIDVIYYLHETGQARFVD
jgi:uncharacterized damage-inducible protein DinB